MQQQAPSSLSKDSDSEVSSREDDPKKPRNPCLRFLRDNIFMLLILVGVAVGFGVGFGAKKLTDVVLAETWIKMPGDLYIRLLQLAILPLISSNLIIGKPLSQLPHFLKDLQRSPASSTIIYADG
ncbi:unnamed protein product [Dibothriocephalus latus]|uniref:Uncharacterized protein n=1 Tax=Dibothriocephalus latus TaxID=60516 RepID=A0A3P7NNM8_DIBLA|nr:unnamed protein product [Dibothriocephalus latus]